MIDLEKNHRNRGDSSWSVENAGPKTRMTGQEREGFYGIFCVTA